MACSSPWSLPCRLPASSSARSLAAALLLTPRSHDIIWRILVSFGAIPALAVYCARRHLKETPRFLKASGHEEDHSGKLKNAAHFDKKTHSVSFWDGFHRMVNDKKILSRLVGASAAWFLHGLRLLRQYCLQSAGALRAR